MPNSELGFDSYTEFMHSENASCAVFSIKKSYEHVDDFKKIDSLKISDEAVEHIESSDDSDESSDLDDERIFYTCKNKKCRIPCPCSQCCSDSGQCSKHSIRHVDLFDEDKHAASVRSADDFCLDESFSPNMYILKYSGILLKCIQCQKEPFTSPKLSFEIS